MSKLFAAVAFAALLPAVALAADHDPTKVPAGRYAVEPYHTRVRFDVDHMGFTNWSGDFTGAAGDLQLNPKNLAGTNLSVTVPTESVTTTNAKLDGELKSADWFDAAQFPTISFKTTKITPTGAGKADVAGELTLHGVTKPVVLKATFRGAGVNPLSKKYTVGFDAAGKIKRSDFGVTKYVPMIGDEVAIAISAAFEKQD
jgi:polyisoprenoid-binding protein YceI